MRLDGLIWMRNTWWISVGRAGAIVVVVACWVVAVAVFVGVFFDFVVAVDSFVAVDVVVCFYFVAKVVVDGRNFMSFVDVVVSVGVVCIAPV